MGRFLIFGSLLAALMGTLSLDQSVESLASNPVNSVFVMQALAFVLSVCSTVDAFPCPGLRRARLPQVHCWPF